MRASLCSSLLALLAGVGLSLACSADDSDGLSEGGAGPAAAIGDGDGGLALGDATAGEGAAAVGDGDGDGGAGGASGDAILPRPEPQPVPAGVLTSGIFDDNLSFDFFLDYREAQFNRLDSGLLPFLAADHQAAHELYPAAQRERTKLDISLVIDTTGSMGDELSYLQSEFDSLTSQIADSYPNSEQRWSLVVYRDVGDDYVSQAFEFSSDLDAFRGTLGMQTYGGGGDFPEAPEAGIADSVALDWRSTEQTARLLFWVADAPHHSERKQEMAEAIESAQDSDIHIYPVASSGVDELTELSMRSAAQLTLGRYLFLTDDSGIGGSHKEPTLPCYYVTTLQAAILRSVATEMSGAVPELREDELVRVGGAITTDGRCATGQQGAESFPF